MTAFTYPVWGFANPRQPTVAIFFTYSDAVDFVNAKPDGQTLYIGEPQYDRRANGYRACDDSGLIEQLTEVHGDPLLKRRVA